MQREAGCVPALASRLRHFQHVIEVGLTVEGEATGMSIPILHRARVALDCECGTTVEAYDDEELLDELLEHIALAHEDGLQLEPAAMLTEAYET